MCFIKKNYRKLKPFIWFFVQRFILKTLSALSKKRKKKFIFFILYTFIILFMTKKERKKEKKANVLLDITINFKLEL